ncbi:putative adhesin [Glaciimonas sp. GG7]
MRLSHYIAPPQKHRQSETYLSNRTHQSFRKVDPSLNFNLRQPLDRVLFALSFMSAVNCVNEKDHVNANRRCATSQKQTLQEALAKAMRGEELKNTVKAQIQTRTESATNTGTDAESAEKTAQTTNTDNRDKKASLATTRVLRTPIVPHAPPLPIPLAAFRSSLPPGSSVNPIKKPASSAIAMVLTERNRLSSYRAGIWPDLMNMATHQPAASYVRVKSDGKGVLFPGIDTAPLQNSRSLTEVMQSGTTTTPKIAQRESLTAFFDRIKDDHPHRPDIRNDLINVTFNRGVVRQYPLRQVITGRFNDQSVFSWKYPVDYPDILRNRIDIRMQGLPDVTRHVAPSPLQKQLLHPYLKLELMFQLAENAIVDKIIDDYNAQHPEALSTLKSTDIVEVRAQEHHLSLYLGKLNLMALGWDWISASKKEYQFSVARIAGNAHLATLDDSHFFFDVKFPGNQPAALINTLEHAGALLKTGLTENFNRFIKDEPAMSGQRKALELIYNYRLLNVLAAITNTSNTTTSAAPTATVGFTCPINVMDDGTDHVMNDLLTNSTPQVRALVATLKSEQPPQRAFLQRKYADKPYGIHLLVGTVSVPYRNEVTGKLSGNLLIDLETSAFYDLPLITAPREAANYRDPIRNEMPDTPKFKMFIKNHLSANARKRLEPARLENFPKPTILSKQALPTPLSIISTDGRINWLKKQAGMLFGNSDKKEMGAPLIFKDMPQIHQLKERGFTRYIPGINLEGLTKSECQAIVIQNGYLVRMEKDIGTESMTLDQIDRRHQLNLLISGLEATAMTLSAGSGIAATVPIKVALAAYAVLAETTAISLKVALIYALETREEVREMLVDILVQAFMLPIGALLDIKDIAAAIRVISRLKNTATLSQDALQQLRQQKQWLFDNGLTTEQVDGLEARLRTLGHAVDGMIGGAPGPSKIIGKGSSVIDPLKSPLPEIPVENLALGSTELRIRASQKFDDIIETLKNTRGLHRIGHLPNAKALNNLFPLDGARAVGPLGIRTMADIDTAMKYTSEIKNSRWNQHYWELFDQLTTIDAFQTLTPALKLESLGKLHDRLKNMVYANRKLNGSKRMPELILLLSEVETALSIVRGEGLFVVLISKGNLQAGYRHIDHKLIQYFAKSSDGSTAANKRLIASFHGFYRDSTNMIALPSGLKVSMLAPHDLPLKDPSLSYIIKSNNWQAYVDIRGNIATPNEFKKIKEGIKHQPEQTQFDKIGQGNERPIGAPGTPDVAPVPGDDIRNYEYVYFENDPTPKEITQIIVDQNTIAKSAQSPDIVGADVLTAHPNILDPRYDETDQLSMKDIITLHNEGKLVNADGEPYEEIVFSHCRSHALERDDEMYSYLVDESAAIEEGVAKGLVPLDVFESTLKFQKTNYVIATIRTGTILVRPTVDILRRIKMLSADIATCA